MKDKLYETGHKKAYYRFKRVLSLSLFALGIGLATAAPIFITYGVEYSKAEAERSKEEETISSQEEKSEALLSYFA